MPFNVWFYVSTFLSPWARDVDQDSCWCRTCSTGHIYLEIGIYQLFIQFECLVHLWGYGHLALGVIVWEQSASSQIETRKLHGNVHFGFDSRNHLTFIVQSLHVFFPSMVCVIPESRPCGYYALWMIKLVTAAKASLSRMYVFCFVSLNTHKGVGTNCEMKFGIWTDADHSLGKVLLCFVLLVQDWAFSETVCLDKCIMWVDTTVGVLLHWIASTIALYTFTGFFVILYDNVHGWLRPIQYEG